jgi:hypothetical protein
VKGNFAGSKLHRLDPVDVSKMQKSIFSPGRCVSAISGLVALRGKDEKDARAYVQGMENLVNSMRGRSYAVVMIADAVSSGVMREIKLGYEMIHTQLSSLLRQTLTLGESDTFTLSQSRSESVAHGITEGITRTQTRGTSVGTSEGKHSGVNASLNFTIPIMGAGASVGASVGASKGKYSGRTSGSSESSSIADSKQTTEQHQTGTSDSEARAQGASRSLQLTSENRSVKDMMDKIDLHIKRIEQCESFGAFDCATYVVADKYEDALTVAGNYSALLRGDESFLQSAQINTWRDDRKKVAGPKKTEVLLKYLSVCAHPSFYMDDDTEVRPSSLIGGREMAIQFGLPKRSVNGLTVLETTPFGRNVPQPQTSALRDRKSVV